MSNSNDFSKSDLLLRKTGARSGALAQAAAAQRDATDLADLSADAPPDLCGHEKFWVERLLQAEPTGVPLANPSGKPSLYRSCQLDIAMDIARRDMKSSRVDFLVTGFLSYLAYVNGAVKIDVGFCKTACNPWLAVLSDSLAGTVPLSIDINMLDSPASLIDAVAAELASVHERGTYARDVALRYPVLAAVRHCLDPAAWPVVIEMVPDLWEPWAGGFVSGGFKGQLKMQIAEDGMTCRWIYDANALDPAHVERMAGNFTRQLAALYGMTQATKKFFYDSIISLGTNCRPKIAMRNLMMGCRRGPLDWMKAPHPTATVNTLKSDFKDFFHPENLAVKLSELPDMCEVTDLRTGLVSLHDFPKRSENLLDDVAGSLVAFHEKYRGINERFLNDIAELDKVLFIFHLQHYWEENEAPVCPQTGIPYAQTIRELLAEIVRLRHGKPFDIFIGTYHPELARLSWPSEVKFFVVDRQWKAWSTVEEDLFWMGMINDVDVYDDAMRKGWPQTGDSAPMYSDF